LIGASDRQGGEDGLQQSSIVWIGLAAVAALALVVAAWLVERRRRHDAETQNRAILSSVFADVAIVRGDEVVEACNDNWLRARASGNPFTAAAPGERWLAADFETAEQRDTLRRIRESLAAVVERRDPERNLEYGWTRGPDRQWSELRIRPLHRPQGGAVVAHLDVTGRKRIEADTRHALHELAHMNVRAEMGELVSTISHELRQALTASLANAQALKRMVASGRLEGEDLTAIVDDISSANRHASEVIGRILTMMRKEAVEMQPLDLNAIVRDVVQTLSSSASNDGVLLVADLDPDLPSISGDRVQLRQVAMNLVTNAVQATRLHTGGLPVVRVGTVANKGTASLIVEDAGAGVPSDVLKRLFEPYFTTKAEGLGVGLTISRSIVESHGGSIAVVNLPHGGARFSVEFPPGE
jgi:signal transduction histidine kinase